MHSMCNENFEYTELVISQEGIALIIIRMCQECEINPHTGRHEATHDQPP